MGGVGSSNNMPTRGLFLVGLFILIGIILRILGSFNDLWLDEVWIIKDIESGINPWLSLFEGASGRDGRASLYTPIASLLVGYSPEILRAPSVLAAFVFLILMYLVSREEGLFTAALSTFLVCTSYVLVLYGSEARGYSGMLLCTLASLLLSEKLRDQHKLGIINLLIFWIISIIGFLFHFSFLAFYLALVIADLYHQATKASKDSTSSAANLKRFLIIHLPLTIFFSSFYLLFIRNLPPGTGTLSSTLDVIIDTVNISMGAPLLTTVFPIQSSFAILLATIIICILAIEIFLLKKDQDERWLFYLFIIFVIPLLIATLLKPRYLAVRYFLPTIIFVYPLLATFLVRIWRRSLSGRILSIIIVGAFVIGNVSYLNSFFNNGRGQYSEAIKFIADSSAMEGDITVGSDQDFRNSMMVGYYSGVGKHPKIKYVDQKQSLSSAPLWYLTHSQDPYLIAQSELNLFNKSYSLQRIYPFTALSGWSWVVYKQKN